MPQGADRQRRDSGGVWGIWLWQDLPLFEDGQPGAA